MVQVIEQSDRFGRIGKAFGEGLADQIPKEIDRYRLNKGLERFKNESLTKTPIEQAIDLYKIPGVTPEIGYTLAPLLKQQQQRNEGYMPGGQQPGSSPTTQSRVNINPGVMNVQGNAPDAGGTKTPFKEEQLIAQANKGLKSKETSVIQRTPFIEPSQQERFNRAQQISQKFPQNFPTPNDAMPFVDKQIGIERANFQAQQQVGNVADAQQNSLRRDLQRKWGSTPEGQEGFGKDIPTSIQNKLYSKMEDEFADPTNKLSENQLTEKYGQIGKNIAQAQKNLEIQGTSKWTNNPKNIDLAFDAAKKAYEAADGLEEFSDLLEGNYYLSPDTAARKVYGIPSYFKNIAKKYITVDPLERALSDDPLDHVMGYEKNAENAVKIANEVAKSITPKDSLLAMAYDINKQGGDAYSFLDQINKLDTREDINLSQRQRREIQKNIPRRRSLYDLYFRFMTGMEK